MIADILRMTRWELFKLRKRWMPWVLLAITAAISQLFLWGFFIAYQNDDITSASSIVYSVENEDGEREYVEFSCGAILDERKLDSLLVRLPEEQREDARRFAELSREQCADQAQLKDWSREIFVLPSSLSNGLGFHSVHCSVRTHDHGRVVDGSRVRLGHVEDGADKGYRAAGNSWGPRPCPSCLSP